MANMLAARLAAIDLNVLNLNVNQVASICALRTAKKCLGLRKQLQTFVWNAPCSFSFAEERPSMAGFIHLPLSGLLPRAVPAMVAVAFEKIDLSAQF
jgi:hypothetical protein